MSAITINDNTKLYELTIGELRGIIREELNQLQPSKEDESYIYGLKALAEFLGVSVACACYRKKAGEFDGCLLTSKTSKRVIVDKNKLKARLLANGTNS